MSDFVDRVMRTVLNRDIMARARELEAAYQADCVKFEAMNDDQLAETVAYYLKNCQRPDWPRGTPVYDAVMWHNLIPEMIKRLRDR